MEPYHVEVEGKMIEGIQIIGILFGLIMVYLTYLYYKKQSYSTQSFILWMVIWVGFLGATIFPSSLYGVMEELSIQRTVDFFIIGGFMFFAVVIFHLFVIIKRLEKQIEEVVRKTAIKKAK
jgi:hypothetical protein